MLNFFLSVLLSVFWLLAFRSFKTFKMNTFQAVVINYWVCVFTGLVSFGSSSNWSTLRYDAPWVLVAAILGAFFILTFYLVAITTQRLGVSVATVSSKISLVVPVLFSLYIFKINEQAFDIFNYLGLVLTLLAIWLTAQHRPSQRQVGKVRDIGTLLLPLVIFALSAAVDTSVNYANLRLLKPQEAALFPIFIFASAAVCGTLVWLYQAIFKKTKLNARSIIGGIYLGVPNFFSLYFLLLALSDFNNNGALLFPLYNIAIILLSAFFAIIIFRERLAAINWLGISLAILAIFLIAYQRIFEQLF